MADSVTVQMQRILDEYDDEVKQASRESMKEEARDVSKKLRAVSPKKTGAYASGWGSKQLDADTAVVYNKKMPGLTHLLENGHVIRNKKGTYGRVAARKHIAPVAAWAEGDLVQRIERKLK